MGRKKKVDPFEGLDRTPPKPRERTKKFTQEQLLDAQKQMLEEREQEIEESEKVAAYVAKKIGLSFGIIESNGSFSAYIGSMRSRGYIANPVKYDLQFLYCQYDKIPTEKFAEIGVIVSEPNSDRYHIGEKIGELDISEIPEFKDFPQKKYSILANYYNAHESGY